MVHCSNAVSQITYQYSAMLFHLQFLYLELFHNVFLLGPGGKAVYQGPVTWAEMYFGSLGFHVPLQANPADYFLDVITCATYGDFTHDPEKLPEYWRRYRESAVYRNAVKKKVNLPKYQSIGIQGMFLFCFINLNILC